MNGGQNANMRGKDHARIPNFKFPLIECQQRRMKAQKGIKREAERRQTGIRRKIDISPSPALSF